MLLLLKKKKLLAAVAATALSDCSCFFFTNLSFGSRPFCEQGPIMKGHARKKETERERERESNVTDTRSDFEMTVLFLVCLKFPSIEQNRTDRRLARGNGHKRTPKESKEIGQEGEPQHKR